MELAYDYPLYRPPSEAQSMIFQVTLGCSFNQCSFCNMYRTKEYSERPWEEVKAEIDLMAKYYPDTKRVFLADGDALNLNTARLVQIIEYIYSKFPYLERVSCYAMPKNILQKTDHDLAILKEKGLGMFYIGIESGNDIVLKKVTKGATYKTILDSINKAKKHGYITSCMIILGLGGLKYSKEHILDTAKLVSESSPTYVGALTLHFEDGIYDEFMTKYNEPFDELDDLQILNELEMLITNINAKTQIVFRANHASNVYSIGGTFPQDKENMLKVIKNLKSHPEMLKPKILRRF